MAALHAAQIRVVNEPEPEPIGSGTAHHHHTATWAQVRRALTRLVVIAGLLVTIAGLAVELVHSRSHAPAVETFVDLLSLSLEGNVPTWYSSCLLFSCAIVLGAIAFDVGLRGGPRRLHWLGLAVGFLCMSIDEAVGLHEHLGGLIGTGGLLYFDWVIPATAVIALVALVYFPFLRDLQARRRRRFIVAGVVYLVGAVGMELPLGWWTERAGDANTTYALIDWIEESMEIAGVSIFLLALVERWHDRAEARP